MSLLRPEFPARCLLLGPLLVAACARPLAPLPPDTPERAARNDSARSDPTATAAVHGQLSEEPIDLEDRRAPDAVDEAETRGESPGTPAELAPAPSPLAAIDASAVPRAVAATRLSEEARVRMMTGDLDGALEQLERAIAVDPQSGFAYYFLAEAHYRRRAYDQAIVFADRSAELLGGRDGAWTSRALALKGRVFETVGRFADARAAYARALDADPTNRDAGAGLARVGGTARLP